MRALRLQFPRWGRLSAGAQQARGWLPGLALCAVIVLAAAFVTGLHAGPPVLYALLFGTLLHHHSQDPRTAPGVEFCVQVVLRWGIGLIGARITVDQVAALGWSTALTVVVASASTLVCGWLAARWLRLPAPLGALAGGATAICGASAALAIAAVLPRTQELDRQTLAVVVMATLLSTLAMFVYPLAARLLQLPPGLAGLFLGATIHDVAQVVVAGYSMGNEVGDVASIVKLFRVSLLVLVVAGVGWAFRARGRDAAGPPVAHRRALLPWFLLMFLGMVALNSAGGLPQALQAGVGQVSQACLTMGAAALGMKASFRQVLQAGWRPALLMGITTLWIAGFVLAAVLA
ncbi:putative sulfate exporter family transporter [Aquincola sp. MAHUQ-54]|uniref:Sulfate exporter family transporter n=1 Tax=Aquincola agrisoli TaxID=3119538 RepID=A0AAW9QDA1_9BURK